MKLERLLASAIKSVSKKEMAKNKELKNQTSKVSNLIDRFIKEKNIGAKNANPKT